LRNYNQVDYAVFFSELEKYSVGLEECLIDLRTAVDISTKSNIGFRFSKRIGNLGFKLQLMLMASTHYYSNQELAWLYRKTFYETIYTKLSDEDKFLADFFINEKWRMELFLKETTLWSDTSIFRMLGNVRKELLAVKAPLRLVPIVPRKPKKPKRKLGYDDYGSKSPEYNPEPAWNSRRTLRTVAEQMAIETSQRDQRALCNGLIGLELEN
jgi:hypothetical protein